MQYALDRVLSVGGTYAATNTKKGITEGEVAILLDQITDPSLSFTSETEDIVDAMNNVVMVLENGRGATFGASNAFFNSDLLAAQVGGEIKSAAGLTFTKYDVLTLDTNKSATLSAKTEETEAKVYVLSKDGSLTTAASVNGTIGEGKVTVESCQENDRVLVVYDAKVSTGERVTALADAKNELLNVTAEVLLRELCNEELYYAYIIFKGKLSGEAEWGMTRDGGHAFEFRCFPEYCGDKTLVEIIIVKGEDLLK